VINVLKNSSYLSKPNGVVAMKKNIIALMMLAAVSSFAADEVYSANIVGFQKIQIPAYGTYSLASINFTGDSDTGLTLSEIFADADLTYSARSSNADKIILWDTSTQTYLTYYQKDDTGLFYLTSDTSTSVDPEIIPGEGFWLSPSKNRTEALDIVVSGTVPTDGSVTITIDEELAMMGTPFAVEFELNDSSIDWVAAGATASSRASNADTITTWDGEQYISYYFKEGAWYNSADGELSTATISLGSGFFYKAKGQVSLTISSPYDLD
jgi:hypothetical protein